jgi:protein-tyrosine phosphatase
MNVLFLCTGNYYRSRFAEIYFNHRAQTIGNGFQAQSRGLEAWAGRNPGPISEHTVRYLSELGIHLPEPHRFPMQMETADWQWPELVIAMDEDEHRPMLQRDFPEYEHRVRFWEYPDTHLADPKFLLPTIRRHIDKAFLAGWN